MSKKKTGRESSAGMPLTSNGGAGGIGGGGVEIVVAIVCLKWSGDREV